MYVYIRESVEGNTIISPEAHYNAVSRSSSVFFQVQGTANKQNSL